MSQAGGLAHSPPDTPSSISTPQSLSISNSGYAFLPTDQDGGGRTNANIHGDDAGHDETRESSDKPPFELPEKQRNVVKRRQWKTSFIRFGPLSGIFCMLLAITCIIASLGILAGSDKQPVLSWTTPPSTYLAIFTAIANLSIRYAAIQGVVIAWWYRALRGSTLSKLHWDWRAGTTLRGAITSGHRMGLLGLACIFSVIVVIDGPLLQRASTIKSAPLIDQTVGLNISIAPQIPHDYSGSWGPYEGLANIAYNKSVPTVRGPVSNQVEGYPTHSFWSLDTISREVTQAWYGDSPIPDAVQGCEGAHCKANITAPALFPTCMTSVVTVDAYQQWGWKTAVSSEQTAPPPFALGFNIGFVLVTSGEREWIAMDISNSIMQKTRCNGVLHTTMCSLESAVGEYSVEIFDNKIQMQTLGMPLKIALSNNTQVNHTAFHPNYFPSTLGGISYMADQRWRSILYRIPESANTTSSVFGGSVPWTLIVQPGTESYECSSYLNVTKDILLSLNKLVVYMGAHAAAHPSISGQMHMDPGLSLHNKAHGKVVGETSKFSTDYWFFFAAAVVEIVCILLISPTYWGWWTIGRPVSLSPLELAKAFEAPILAECNSNSSGRDLAKFVADVRVQYGAAHINDGETTVGQHGKLAFSDPSAASTPQNGSRFSV